MPIRQKFGYVEVGSDKLAEVISCKATSSPTETDTSIIGRSDANFSARVDVEYGPIDLTVMAYVDPTDVAQGALSQGSDGHSITHYPGGDAVGMIKRVYSDCLVLTRDDGSESSYNDYWKYEFKMKCNGGLVETVIS